MKHLLMLLALSAPAWAHPGRGLVVDKQGSVYFIDAFRDRSNRILKLDAQGKLMTFFESKDVAVMHHLAAGPDGTLITAGDDGRVWTIRDGKAALLDDLQPLRIGWGGDPFTVDPKGAIYAVNERHRKLCQIVRVDRDGRITSIAGGGSGGKDGKADEAQFEALHGSSFAFGPDAALYLTDNGARVRKIKDGIVSTVADGLKDAGGLAIDERGVLYVTETGRVSKIVDGKPVAVSDFESPVGVAVSAAAVYVLENTDAAIVRVHRIVDGKVTTLAEVRP